MTNNNTIMTKNRRLSPDNLGDMVETFRQKSAEERASTLLRAWFDLAEAKEKRGETVSEGLQQSFSRWMNDPHEWGAKDEALQHMIDEAEREITQTCKINKR
jgi:hypothetical protein